MKNKSIRMKRIFPAALILLVLTGCGSKAEKLPEASAQIRELDYAGALKSLDEAEAQGENSRLINRSRGIAYMGMTEYDKAIEAFLTSLRESNGILWSLDFDTNYYLAAAYMKNGDYAQARETYDAILGLRPQQEDALFLRGNAKMNLSDYDGAKADFDACIALNPKNFSRIIEIYEVMDYFGYGQVGREYLQNTLNAYEKEMSNDNIGRMYFYLGEYQRAYLALEEAREKGGADSYLYLGRSYEATGDYNYAISVYLGYLNKHDPDSRIYNQLGICQMAKGEYKAALEAFQNGLALENPVNTQTLTYNEIVTYEYLGEFQKAYELMQKYVQKYPDDEKAARELIFLKTR